MRNILHWWGLALLIAALDQLSKFYINATLSPTEPIVLTGWFNLVLAHNSGAAFSFLAQRRAGSAISFQAFLSSLLYF